MRSELGDPSVSQSFQGIIDPDREPIRQSIHLKHKM